METSDMMSTHSALQETSGHVMSKSQKQSLIIKIGDTVTIEGTGRSLSLKIFPIRQGSAAP